MMNFYFIKTNKLIKSLSRDTLSDRSFCMYLSYLIILFILYYFLPTSLQLVPNEKVKRLSSITIFSEIFIILIFSFMIYDKANMKDIWSYIKTYIAIYSTEFFSFALIKIIFTFIVLYLFIKLNIQSEVGFEKSHYLNLSSELICVLGGELFVQIIMILRFNQLKKIRNHLEV